MTIMELIYAFGVIFAASEMGQRLQQAFDECSDIIYQLDWYLFPAEIQRILPIIINFSQQPIIFECFGSMVCDRETFKYVSYRIEKLSIKLFSNIDKISLYFPGCE